MIAMDRHDAPFAARLLAAGRRSCRWAGCGMLLSVSNPFDAPLKFKMVMMPLESERFAATSSCPAVPHGSVFESWPFPIFRVLLTEGRTLGRKESLVCEE